MKVAIIDDEPLARMELHYLLEQTAEAEAIYEGESIEDAFRLLITEKPDLLFLDIHLTDESGLNLAKKLVQVPNPPLIIFATAYDNHALEAFEVNAIDYLLKPFEQARVQKAVIKAQQILTANQQAVPSKPIEKNPERLTIETDERIYLLPYGEILYCEVEGKQTSVHTKTAVYQTTTTLASIEKALQAAMFLRVHRSYIINIHEIKEIQPWFNQTYQVTMNNGGKVPVSRSYLKSFKEAVGL